MFWRQSARDLSRAHTWSKYGVATEDQTANVSTPKQEKPADGGASLEETYLVQGTEGEWYVVELIQRSDNSENDESEYSVHCDGCK